MSTGKLVFVGIALVGAIYILNTNPGAINWVTDRVTGFSNGLLSGSKTKLA